jgi:hypothetical protein
MAKTNTPPPNNAEELAFAICRRSFLSLWAYRSPKQRPHGDELCDVLVVCDPDVLIFSVKDVSWKDTKRPSIDESRWRRRAIQESCAQIYGAETTIKSSKSVIRFDGEVGLPFPNPAIIHRLAVAFGSRGKVSLPFGDFGKGFVHVLDERSIGILLGELDTTTDFVNYLRDKEEFFRSTTCTQFEGAEEDLLALYLHRGRQFPSGYDALLIGANLWEEIQSKPEYKRKVAEDAASYLWDGLIESFCKGALNNDLEFGSDMTSAERAIRIIARENRFSRRVLAKSFKEFLDSSHEIRARMNQSPSGVMYVYLAMPHGTPRNFRVAELSNRCFVARGLRKNTKTVVGIATEQYEKGKGFSLDLVHLHIPTWTVEAQARMEAMQKELGYFVVPRETLTHEDEYPIP